MSERDPSLGDGVLRDLRSKRKYKKTRDKGKETDKAEVDTRPEETDGRQEEEKLGERSTRERKKEKSS